MTELLILKNINHKWEMEKTIKKNTLITLISRKTHVKQQQKNSQYDTHNPLEGTWPSFAQLKCMHCLPNRKK